MNTQDQHKYDVAISFLQEDEGIARKLSDLLSDRLTTFAYYDRQKEVAGTDGEVIFNKVFGQESRIVVILYRATWGTTPWTRIEQTAIRNRGYDDGYEFVIMIPLDDKPTAPKWLPKTSIWVGLDRWGIESAAAVIEARVQKSGGVPREETPLEQANRMNRQKQDEEKRLALINSEDGVSKANAEVDVLFNEIKKFSSEITQAGGDVDFVCNIEKPINISHRQLNLSSWGYHAYISWIYTYNNTLHDSLLEIRLLKSSRFTCFTNKPPPALTVDEYEFDLRLPDQFGWRYKHDKKFFSSTQLAARCVKQLLKRIQEDKPWASE